MLGSVAQHVEQSSSGTSSQVALLLLSSSATAPDSSAGGVDSHSISNDLRYAMSSIKRGIILAAATGPGC